MLSACHGGTGSRSRTKRIAGSKKKKDTTKEWWRRRTSEIENVMVEGDERKDEGVGGEEETWCSTKTYGFIFVLDESNSVPSCLLAV